MAGFAVGLLLRALLGAGTLRGLRDLLARSEAASAALRAGLRRFWSFWGPMARTMRLVHFA